MYILQLDVVAQKLNHRQTIAVTQRAWDVAFDDSSGLWILDGGMVVLYQAQEGHWQVWGQWGGGGMSCWVVIDDGDHQDERSLHRRLLNLFLEM